MLIKEIMVKDVISIRANDTVYNACVKYKDKKVGCLLVTNREGDCIGIVTERDFIERIICTRKEPDKTKISEIMSTEIITIHALDRIEKAAETMLKYRIKKLPVIVNNKIVGIITVTDLSREIPDFSRKYCEFCASPD
jgi:CBS domain-containing protein